ncbi:SDR family NAD(P)-dependent oxidoreductase [Pseudomonas qingdaonensis]|nr:SDR family NAD(P)-dependent oxidoreductase [Pseudomonas qingdaonensis]
MPTTLLLCDDPQAFAQLPAQLRDAAWRLVPAQQFHYTSPRTVEADLGDARHIDLLLRLLTSQQQVPARLLIDLRSTGSLDAGLGEGLDAALATADLLHHLCQGQSTPALHTRIVLHPGPVSALEGLLRSVVQEIPSLSASLIETSHQPGSAEREALAHELLAAEQPGVNRVSLCEGQRHVASLRFVTPGAVTAPAQLSAGDVLVISGGLGAVGRALGEALASLGGLRLAVLGRRALDADAARWLERLTHLGADDAAYWQADCADADSLHTALASIRQRYGACHGVIHCAGVLQDGFFLRQPAQERASVLQGKTLAARHLDAATADDPLKLFMVCSSLAGVYGNVGQSAYALANAWLDRFVQARQQRCASGQRQGPLAVDCLATVADRQRHAGPGAGAPMAGSPWPGPVAERSGVATFLRCLALAQAVLIPVCGKRDAVARLFGIEAPPARPCRSRRRRPATRPACSTTSPVNWPR